MSRRERLDALPMWGNTTTLSSPSIELDQLETSGPVSDWVAQQPGFIDRKLVRSNASSVAARPQKLDDTVKALEPFHRLKSNTDIGLSWMDYTMAMRSLPRAGPIN